MWWQPECLARLARVWSQACKFSGPVRSTEDISLNVNRYTNRYLGTYAGPVFSGVYGRLNELTWDFELLLQDGDMRWGMESSSSINTS